MRLLLLLQLLELLPLADLGARGLPPDVAAPPDETLRCAEGRHGRADVEVEHRLVAVGVGLAGVVVDDVADLLGGAADPAGDEPVVAVEGGLGPVLNVSTDVLSFSIGAAYSNLEG